MGCCICNLSCNPLLLQLTVLHDLVEWQGQAHQGPAALQATLASTCYRTPCSVEHHMIPQEDYVVQQQ